MRASSHFHVEDGGHGRDHGPEEAQGRWREGPGTDGRGCEGEGREGADVEGMQVQELRNELEKRGLDATGVKAVLLERLEEAMKGEGNPDEEAEAGEGAEDGDAVTAPKGQGTEQPPAAEEKTVPPEEEADAKAEEDAQEPQETEEQAKVEEETEVERMRKRAERFGMTFAASEEQRKEMRAQRFGLDSTLDDVIAEKKKRKKVMYKKGRNDKPGASRGPTTPNPSNQGSKKAMSEALKKRAERFGLPVKGQEGANKSKKAIEKRPPPVDPEWEAKKRARAERFGLPLQ